jgi:hypothetical protein
MVAKKLHATVQTLFMHKDTAFASGMVLSVSLAAGKQEGRSALQQPFLQLMRGMFSPYQPLLFAI